ncbi:MAG: hypothetical protein AAB473_01210 [Patescibacteria group bacterium]
MDTPRIVIPKRRFLVGKTAWIVAVIAGVVLVGTVIQMRMTWTRERTRGVTSDAVDLLNTVKTELGTVLPPASVLAPITDAFTSDSSTSSSN